MLIIFNAAKNFFVIEIVIYFVFFMFTFRPVFNLYLASIFVLYFLPQSFILMPGCFYWLNIYIIMQSDILDLRHYLSFVPVIIHFIFNIVCITHLSSDAGIFFFYLSSQLYISILMANNRNHRVHKANIISLCLVGICLIFCINNSPEFLILFLHAFHTYSLQLAIVDEPELKEGLLYILSTVTLITLLLWYAVPLQLLSPSMPICKLCDYIVYHSRIYTSQYEYLSTPEAGLYYQALRIRDYSYMLDYTPNGVLTSASVIVPTLFSLNTPLEYIDPTIMLKGRTISQQYSIDNVFYSMNILLHSNDEELISQYYIMWRSYYEQIERDNTDQLIVNVNGTLRHFGFMNEVILDGKPLFVSLLMYNTLSRIVVQYQSCPHRDEYINTLKVLETSFSKFKKSPTRPWYTACIECKYNANITDVWGTMYLASLNLTTYRDKQTLERSIFTVSQWGGIPHVLRNESWTTCWKKSCPKKGTFQNGGYWVLPYSWTHTFMENQNTRQWIKNNLEFHMSHQVAPLWIGADGIRSPYNVYATTCTSIYSVFNCST